MLAVVYTRYSTDKQRKASTADQFRICTGRISAERWTLHRHYSDQEISGAISARPDYLRMQEDAARKEFQILVVDDLSRLGRDHVEQERLIRRFEFAGIRIIAVTDGYDSQSKARKVIRGMLGMRNEMQLDQIRAQVHRGLTGQALQKRSAGGLSYGYRPVPIFLGDRIDGFGREIHPERAEIVREIFKRFADGDSLREIANDLNARGVAPPGASWKRSEINTNRVWRISAIQAMLGNEIYVGRYIWNRSRWELNPDTEKRQRFERPQSEWIVHDLPALQIVDPPLWDRVQSRMRYRSQAYRPGSGGKPKYLLSGLLRCGMCGAPFVIGMHQPIRYACSTFKHAGESVCANRLRVAKDLAEEKILAPIVNELLSDKAVELAVNHIQRLVQEHATTVVQDTRSVELSRIDAEIAELDRLQAAGTLSPTVSGAARARAQEERQRIQRDRNSGNLTHVVFGAASLYREKAKRFRTAITGHDMHVARAALKELLGEIRLVPTDGVLVAEFGAQTMPLVVNGDEKRCGSGGPLWFRFRITLTA
jgi:site-specific DNA recombinase